MSSSIGSFGGGGFGGAAPAPATPFSSNTFGVAPGSSFGQAISIEAPSTTKFGGRNPRDMLASFYQKHNPNKLDEVDTLLNKYAGREEQLFLNLARKYNLDPSIFGVAASQPVTTPSTGAVAFGSPAPIGNTSLFGSASTVGGLSGSRGGFGTSSGFGSASQGGGFGSLASSTGGGFGSLASSAVGGGFGGFSGGLSRSQQNPFGEARR